MEKKYYTAGEIHRLGLLKTFYGEPYKQKASVTQIVKHMENVQKVPTPHGVGFAVPVEEIEKYNAHWTKYYL